MSWSPVLRGEAVSLTARFPRTKRVFSGGSESFVAFFALGVLASSFFKLDWWRDVLLGPFAPAPSSVLAFSVVLSALVWRSLLRRPFVWADPARLSWVDFAAPGRVRTLNGRLGAGWFSRVLALVYVSALLATVYAVPPAIWWAGAGVLVSSATLAFASARHPGGEDGPESAATVLLAGIGVFLGSAGASIFWLVVLTVVLLVATVFRIHGSGKPLQPTVATAAGRAVLIEGWRERVVRAVSITFLEPMMMLPSARPMDRWKLRGATALRLACVGALARARYTSTAILLACAVATAYRALPALPPVLLAGVGAYVAVMPFAAGIGQLWRTPGKRRWLGAGDARLRCWHGLVLLGLVCVWGGVLAALAASLGVELPWETWLVFPLAAGAILRTATRPVPTYDNLGVVETGIGMLPVRLIKQFVRGPDVGILGLALIAVLPAPAAIPTTAALTTFTLLR